MCAPNGGWVEAARAVVLFMGGQALSAKAWFDHVKSRIALFDALVTVTVVDELPRTRCGTPRERAVRVRDRCAADVQAARCFRRW